MCNSYTPQYFIDVGYPSDMGTGCKAPLELIYNRVIRWNLKDLTYHKLLIYDPQSQRL